jgi:hypothetical protein
MVSAEAGLTGGKTLILNAQKHIITDPDFYTKFE